MNDFSGKSIKGSESAPASNGSWENPSGPPPFERSRAKLLWFLPVFLGGLILYLVISGYGSLMKLNQLAQRRDTLVQSNHDLNHTNENMYREIVRLKQDPAYLEEIARKEFGLVKPDEIIFFLDQEYKKEGNP